MPFRFQQVKRFKRGATWPDGEPRMCTRCAVEVAHELKRRKRRAVVTAVIRHGKYRVPVGYCAGHVPEGI